MSTLLIGADGQLGGELGQAFGDCELVSLTYAVLELVDRIQKAKSPTMLQPVRHTSLPQC